MTSWRGVTRTIAAWVLLAGIVAQAILVPGALYLLCVGIAVFLIAFLTPRDYAVVALVGLLLAPRLISLLPLHTILPTIRLGLLLLVSGACFAAAVALIFRYRTKVKRGSFSVAEDKTRTPCI